MVRPLRHRQTKGAATDMPDLTPPRHIPTLPDQAIRLRIARLAIGEFPPESGRNAEAAWLVLIAAESVNGQDAEAREDLQKFLATPRTLRTMVEIQKVDYIAVPKLLDGLRRAGMPEG